MIYPWSENDKLHKHSGDKMDKVISISAFDVNNSEGYV